MKYLNGLIFTLLLWGSPFYAMWGRDAEVGVSIMLTNEQPKNNRPSTLATLQASFKIMQSAGQKQIEQTDISLSPYLKVENEGPTPHNQITLCYTAVVDGQCETLMNHFPLAKKSTKEFETSLKDSSGKFLWLTITCTPKK